MSEDQARARLLCADWGHESGERTGGLCPRCGELITQFRVLRGGGDRFDGRWIAVEQVRCGTPRDLYPPFGMEEVRFRRTERTETREDGAVAEVWEALPGEEAANVLRDFKVRVTADLSVGKSGAFLKKMREIRQDKQ